MTIQCKELKSRHHHLTILHNIWQVDIIVWKDDFLDHYVDLLDRYIDVSENYVDLSDIKLTSKRKLGALIPYKDKIL